jgi:hypothetical protein
MIAFGKDGWMSSFGTDGWKTKGMDDWLKAGMICWANGMAGWYKDGR